MRTSERFKGGLFGLLFFMVSSGASGLSVGLSSGASLGASGGSALCEASGAASGARASSAGLPEASSLCEASGGASGASASSAGLPEVSALCEASGAASGASASSAGLSEGLPPVVGLSRAWAGGMNACHFAALDMDGDGKDDYIAFDRIGSRVRCYSSSWNPLPGAEALLPPLFSWVQTADYDNDGRLDIFTFNGVSGIALYRNLSYSEAGEYRLRFQKITDDLSAEMFRQNIPIYCTGEDYPVIADLDGDGDLDVLNFWVPSSGDYLLYYRNYAFEELNRNDTAVFRLEDWSWGCFVESEESNQIFLDSCSPRNEDLKRGSAATGVFDRETPKHSGSTLWAFKNAQTGLFDLVLGDVGYPDMFYLQNGGTPLRARIVKYDTSFPKTEPVRLFTFPILSCIVYRDTLCYVYSPYQRTPFMAEGEESLWRYADSAGTGAPYACLREKSFLQNTMIDVGAGAYPAVYDYNRDGLADLVIGNYGRRVGEKFVYGEWQAEMCASLTLYENIGTEEEPVFRHITDDYLGLSRYGLRGLYPAFADMDADGTDEMVLGTEDGNLWLFRLTEEGAVPVDSNFLGGGFSGFSAPVFFDLNGDGWQDLIVGEKQRVWTEASRRLTKGSLSYFQNKGVSGGFERITDSLGGVDVIVRDFSNFGYSRPSFWREGDGRVLLACGGENGEVFLYDSIENNLCGNFRFLGRASTQDAVIREGLHAAPLLFDWNADGKPEMIVGNQCGGLAFFPEQVRALLPSVSLCPPSLLSESDIRVYPNPFRFSFRVKVETAGGYTLRDMRGRAVGAGKLQEGVNVLDFPQLPSGIYFLHVVDKMHAAGRVFKIICNR